LYSIFLPHVELILRSIANAKRLHPVNCNSEELETLFEKDKILQKLYGKTV